DVRETVLTAASGLHSRRHPWCSVADAEPATNETQQGAARAMLPARRFSYVHLDARNAPRLQPEQPHPRNDRRRDNIGQRPLIPIAVPIIDIRQEGIDPTMPAVTPRTLSRLRPSAVDCSTAIVMPECRTE